jgi:hypothetical protein
VVDVDVGARPAAAGVRHPGGDRFRDVWRSKAAWALSLTPQQRQASFWHLLVITPEEELARIQALLEGPLGRG